jgi:hypothetical protein
LLSGLASSLTNDHSAYQPGQPVEMTFQETNVSGHPVVVEDGPSNNGFIVRRDRQGDAMVWQSNAGINPDRIRRDILQPGQSLTLRATWGGIPTGGSAPVAGRFVISDQLDSNGATATILVR